MESILSELRKGKDRPNENMSDLASYFILFILLGFGYFVFFFNPDNVLGYIRTPLVILYIILVVFVSFFILKRQKINNPMFNLGAELSSHTTTFLKMFLLLVVMFISFYLFYRLMIQILVKSLNVSIFLTIIILFIVLAIIDSYIHISDEELPNEIIDFVKDLIFYIPCLIADFIEYMKKDYTNTPSTVIILFIILVIICLLYVASLYMHYNNPLLLIDKPAYLNNQLVSLNQMQLETLIIQSRPWYEKELLRLQHSKDKSFDISFNPLSGILKTSEGFTSVISQEIIPIHLAITDYERYILAQAMYNNHSIADTIQDISGNVKEYIQYIIKQQKKVMSHYERLLLSLAFYSSSNLSQTLLGDINGNKYHYSISFWLYLFSDRNMIGKDKILHYGSRPSLYYDHATKELSVEIIQNGQPVVLYSSSNILYQRWNHIVMNYNYGTFDLFINNNLVSTNGDIVDFVSPDELLQVGFNTNNNLGGIAQLQYSEQPLQLNEIGSLYLQKPKI